ncbi:MAG: peptidase MA family metallohydrolase [bacterium]
MQQSIFFKLKMTFNRKYDGWMNVAYVLPLLFITVSATEAFGQFGDIFGFGKNKVQYKSFDWSVINTEHFDIHYYKEERQAAMDAAEIAERSYAYLSEVLDYKFKQKIPMLLYASHNDFQQTNAIQSYISEGTQGVTESLKGRMILPITGSYAQFIHVLTHEMVHAFQFDILLSDGPADLVRRFNPPLWFMEGMAEYLSVGMDNITRMWMRDAVLNNTLLTIPEMNLVFDIRVYRMGQAIWYYVGERYGKEVVGRIFKTARATGDLNRAFKAHTGLDLNELSKRWQDDARTRYLPANVLLKKPEEVAEPLTDPCLDCTRLNIVPAISPDGNSLAYIGDKDYTLNMFLRSLEDKDKMHKIVRSGSSESYESLRYFNTSMNWSPDGNYFSFVSKAGGNDAIYIVNANKKKIMKKLKFKELTGMAAPSWSPDGGRMVFSGIHGGISDLYVVNRDGANLQKLTHDRYSYLHPQWSPDGKTIAFTTDRGPNTHIDELIFGEYNIALYDIETGTFDMLTETGGNHINPIWSADGTEIYFISDMSGIPNIYSIELETREIYRITNFITGVAGIITESPAISLATETGRLAFSAFSNGGWYIYTLDEYEKEKIDRSEVLVLEPLEDSNEKYFEYTLGDSSEFLLSDYNSKLSPDLIVGGGAFATNVGFAGQTAFLFSDMLGDKTLILQAALFGDPLESTIIATYFNQKHRLNYAISAFQFRDDFGVFTATDDEDFAFVSQIFRGFGLGASLPFDTFTRLELGADVFFVNSEVVGFNFTTGRSTSRNGSNAIFSSFDVSLVRDSAFWGIAAPISGTRARLTIAQNVGDLQYTSIIADYRKYFAISIPRYSVAYRITAGTNLGRDKRIFGIGGPFTFRGADFGDISGTNVFFQNVEFRFPLFPYLPLQYDFLTGVAFFDAAHAWGVDRNRDNISFNLFDDFSDIKTSYGLGIRFNLGGLLVLRWDFPFKRYRSPVTGLLSPKTHFSIGVDF